MIFYLLKLEQITKYLENSDESKTIFLKNKKYKEFR